MKQPKPSDFDWVTTRRGCSPAAVFESLRQLAQRDVDTFNSARSQTGERADAHFASAVPGVFSVTRGAPVGGIPHAVRFTLRQRDGTIAVESQGVALEAFTATLTLNNDGECRLKVGSQELDLWQVLRHSLEPLLFGLNDWDI